MSIQRLITTLIIIAILLPITSAQEDSPTPAPSKTPSPLSIATTTSIPNTKTTTTRLMTPFTQEDLKVLVGNVQRPNGIAWFDNNLYTACSGDWTLYAINDTTGSTITFVFGVRNAHTILAEKTTEGFNLWVPDFDTNSLVHINQRRSAPNIITSQLEGPWGITFIDNDSFLISNLLGNNIVKVTRDGNITEIVNRLRSPAGIIAHNNKVYFANNGSARRAIEWFNLEDNIPKRLVSGLQNTTGLVLSEDGYLYFTFSLGNRGAVGRIQPSECEDKGCTNEQIEIVLYTELSAPLAGLAISPDNRLFVHTIYRPEIYWLQLP